MGNSHLACLATEDMAHHLSDFRLASGLDHLKGLAICYYATVLLDQFFICVFINVLHFIHSSSHCVSVCAYVCLCIVEVSTPATAHVEHRGQLAGVVSLLHPYTACVGSRE